MRNALIAPLLAVLLTSLAGASASDLTARRPVESERPSPANGAALHGRDVPRPVVAGEDIATALPIAVLPYADFGTTCGFLDDYDEVCPFDGSTAPDVVYAYTPGHDSHIGVSLCESAYDTKVYVYENAWPNLVACNDDACGPDGYRSEIFSLPVIAGNTYYIVVDGYGELCGDFFLQIDEVVFETLECPADAIAEGEPDCYDGYEDQFNSGCKAYPQPAFSTLHGTANGRSFAVCGTSGTFLFEGSSFRDSDWYELQVVEENTITFKCTAQFPVLIVVMDANAGCEGPPEVLGSAEAGVFPDVATISYTFPPGVYWFWVGPSVFTGIPCGRLYVLTVTGFTGDATSVSTSARIPSASWSAIKNLYR
jgi:hypothetical protein